MIEQALDRSIESLCERIPNLVLRDLGPLTIAIQNLCIARAALTEQRSSNLENTPYDDTDIMKKILDRFAGDNIRELINL